MMYINSVMFERPFFEAPWETHILVLLKILTPPVETPDPPNDTPFQGLKTTVILTPHDIPRILRAS